MKDSKNNKADSPSNETVPDCLITRTPFHLENGWELITENTNTSCSHAQIDALIQKRVINLIDMEIMKVLASYHYVNHYNLAKALQLRLHPGYYKISYLDNIRKLKKAGILLSYCPVGEKDMPANAPVSPLKLYSLSQSAYTYMIPIAPNAHPPLPSSARRKIELAATNQFLIQFEFHYGTKIEKIEYQKGTKLGNTPFLLDALIQYRPTFHKKQKPPITFFVLSIRKQHGWEKNALSRIHLLNVWYTRHEAEYLLPLPILLVEDIAMAIALYAQIQLTKSFSELPIYYCLDNLLMVYPPLQSLYRCKVEEDGKISAIRLTLEI